MAPQATPTRFGEMTVGGFVERLASSDPVPGGGSASAVAASLGAGLVAMVASLSERPRYAQHAALHARARDAGNRLAERSLTLADDDAAAYGAFGSAMRMPRDTDEQRAARAAAIAVAARRAAEVPLETVEACREIVAEAEALAGRSNVNASSDLSVASLLGEAAARGAAMNVLVNLPSVDDAEWAADARARVETLLREIEGLAARTRAVVTAGAAREPLEPLELEPLR